MKTCNSLRTESRKSLGDPGKKYKLNVPFSYGAGKVSVGNKNTFFLLVGFQLLHK